MKTREFFILIIKLISLCGLLFAIFENIPTLISYLSFMIQGSGAMILGSIMLVIIIGFYCYIILKAPNIVDYLKLTKGFEEDELKMGFLNEASIIKISCIVLGGILFVNNLPAFINSTLRAIKFETFENDFDLAQNTSWLINFFYVAIGLLLIFYYKKVQQLISKENVDSDEIQ